MNKKPKVIAILIAYRAEKTLKKFWFKFPRKYFDEIILIDDASDDRTFKIAQKLHGLHAYRNNINLGYGGNLKVCLSKALEKNADIVIEIHPDEEYKYSSQLLNSALDKINKGSHLILGNRFAEDLDPLKNGMEIWKYYPIRALTLLSNMILRTNLSDLHQGFKVYTNKLLQEVDYMNNSNNYLFSFEIIVQAKSRNLIIDQVPIEVSYSGKKRGASLKAGFIYSLGTIKTLFFYFMERIGIKQLN